MKNKQADRLIEAAHEAAERAYAPHSNFHVGAALLCEKGEIVTGCNVENSSLGLTICAERNAVFAAINQGCKKFQAIAIVAYPSDDPVTPCGACRQVLWEFAPDLIVISATRSGKTATYKLRDLLPQAFG